PRRQRIPGLQDRLAAWHLLGWDAKTWIVYSKADASDKREKGIWISLFYHPTPSNSRRSVAGRKQVAVKIQQ
ncbi:MAG: hypothetical protein ABL965_08565, partial [Nitrospira sp.]